MPEHLSTGKHRRIVIWAVVFGGLLWVIDAALDVLFFYGNEEEQHLWNLLVPANPQEIYMRGAMLVLCLAFGVLISKYVEKFERSEAALRENEKKYRALFKNTPVGLGLADSRGVLIDFNDAMLKPGGYTREDIVEIGNVANLYWKSEDRDRILAKARQQGFVYQEEVQFIRKDGTPYDTLLSLTPVEIHGQPCWQAMVEDITRRKQTEREMVRMERLNALGELSGGISHNLNNILTGILGPAEIIKNATANSELRQISDLIFKSAQRAAELVRRFHATIEGGKEDKNVQPVALDPIVQEAVDLTKPKWKDESESAGIVIEVHARLGETAPVRANKSELRDILLNLLINAVEAMPQGGAITLESTAEDDGVLLTVTDTGIGMDEATQRRIFEPFFTTKATVGTGLGLSTAYIAVHRWGGRIDVDSKPGQGTAFSIRLPIWTDPISPPEQNIPLVRSSILVVDDDLTVIRFMERALSPHHDIRAFTDAREALAQFQSGQYDMAFIDLGMPHMPGDQVARQMRQCDPALVTILITGWTLAEEDPRHRAFDFHLEKPISGLDSIQAVIARAQSLRVGRNTL